MNAPQSPTPNLAYQDDDLAHELYKAACVGDVLGLLADLEQSGEISDRDPDGHVQDGRAYLTKCLAATLHQLTARADRLGKRRETR